MSKTRKILATLTMVAVATTASLTAISSAQAHPTGTPHLHAVPGPVFPVPGPTYTGPLFPIPGPLTPAPTPTPTPAPPHHHGGLRRGEAAALGLLGGVILGGVIANANRRQAPAPAPAVGLPAAHYAFCDAKYRSYVIATNTFTGYDGRQHYCNSPYI
jgi:hypothetical protein